MRKNHQKKSMSQKGIPLKEKSICNSNALKDNVPAQLQMFQENLSLDR